MRTKTKLKNVNLFNAYHDYIIILCSITCRTERWYDHTNMIQVHVRRCPLFVTDTMTSRNLSLLLSYTCWAVQIPSSQLPRITITDETRKVFSVNSKMEEILDIIFKADIHSIISFENLTDTCYPIVLRVRELRHLNCPISIFDSVSE